MDLVICFVSWDHLYIFCSPVPYPNNAISIKLCEEKIMLSFVAGKLLCHTYELKANCLKLLKVFCRVRIEAAAALASTASEVCFLLITILIACTC